MEAIAHILGENEEGIERRLEGVGHLVLIDIGVLELLDDELGPAQSV